MAGRDQARLDEAARAIRAASPRAELRTLVLDLADLASVHAAAKEIAGSETVDLLINNAGVITCRSGGPPGTGSRRPLAPITSVTSYSTPRCGRRSGGRWRPGS